MTDATQVTSRFDPLDDDDEFADELPARPRRRWLTPWSALALALLVGAVGFYVGVRVQKASGGAAAAVVSRSGLPGLSGSSASSLRSKFAGGGGFPGAGGTGKSVAGTVSSRDGNTLYVTETGGNIVRVKLSSATEVTKSESVAGSKITPGDTITVSGQKGASGSVMAVSVSDSGASSSSASRGTSSGSSSSSGTGSGGSGSVSSLFGG